MMEKTGKKLEYLIEYNIFASRWLQAPLYLGLIIAQIAYTLKFIETLFHALIHAPSIGEQDFLLIILGLIDTIMVANLIAQVTIGGYATFVSKMHMSQHPDRPDWLAHVDAGAIKVKLSSSLIGISSIHLLTTFINIEHTEPEQVKWLILIHLTFILSTLILALSELLMAKKYSKKH